MDSLKERAARWGIETEYWDGLKRFRAVELETLTRLLDTLTAGATPCEATVLAPDLHAYQGAEAAPKKTWALAVQLYGVTSARNWGHGDFTDLKALMEAAAALGASGIGLNPLHALFDDRAEEFSPYYPSSRVFLNTHYIDVEAIPEFPASSLAEFAERLADLRKAPLVDYAGVIEMKGLALMLAYRTFRKRGKKARKLAFAQFREQGGALLTRFSCFEYLRRKLGSPWWEWPEEWRKPDDAKLAALRAKEDSGTGYHEYLQWIANAQLSAARDHAAELRMPIGLYLDIAVGVRADGFDAWNAQGVVERGVEIGAPPDPLNVEGQRWGLAGVNPFTLAEQDCEPFRQVLRASMRYAGAVRLDHAMALQRLYLVPAGMRGDQGAYVGFPFARMLAVTAEESVRNRCIVIGEDLGTVPDHFRERLAAAGIWSYQVMLFQRAVDGGFIAPDLYRENALVTFATHDLPTFDGWMSGHDIGVKRALGLDPGETLDERHAAQEAMKRTIAWNGGHPMDYAGVMDFLAQTPSRLLVVSAEDVLQLDEQVNVPGTVHEHPNWRRRVDLDALIHAPRLTALAQALRRAGRSSR